MSKYIALLRGINVGGNNKVEMPKLKKVFEKLGFSNVITYINSGNVIFETGEKDTKKLIKEIEGSLKEAFTFDLRIVLRDAGNIKNICGKIPHDWQNNIDQKTDIMFLWEEVDSKESLKLIVTNPGVDSLLYIAGAVVWNVKRIEYAKSGMHKFIGTKIYKNMTARNVNTLRKINELLGK